MNIHLHIIINIGVSEKYQQFVSYDGVSEKYQQLVSYDTKISFRPRIK